ncbi:MAG: glycosyltransferase [Phycisphaerae bacterium]|nr:glycosyltransferase [Phycisphaerae bacterium]
MLKPGRSILIRGASGSGKTTLLNALARSPEIDQHFSIVRPERLRDHHGACVSAFGRAVSLEDALACLARADLFAQASKHENFGLSVAEALQFGVPCVASDGVALAADVQQHGAGLMCPPTVDDFTANLRTLMADETYRNRCAAAARRLAERFAPAAVAEALEREYRVCLGEPISGQAARTASGVGGRGD